MDEFRHWRGKVGGLIRDRADDDPELVTARAKMEEEAFVAAIAAAMKKAPREMSPELRERVLGLLGSTTAAAAGLTPRSRRRIGA